MGAKGGQIVNHCLPHRMSRDVDNQKSSRTIGHRSRFLTLLYAASVWREVDESARHTCTALVAVTSSTLDRQPKARAEYSLDEKSSGRFPLDEKNLCYYAALI